MHPSRNTDKSSTDKIEAILAQAEMLPGDEPKHKVRPSSRSFRTTSNDLDIGNFKSPVVELADSTASSGTHRGEETALHPNGDRTFLAYEGSTKHE